MKTTFAGNTNPFTGRDIDSYQDTKMTTAYYAKATLLNNKLGVFVYPAVHEFLKPQVLAAKTLARFNAAGALRSGVLLTLHTQRMELYEVRLTEDAEKCVLVTAKTDTGDMFSETYREAIVIE